MTTLIKFAKAVNNAFSRRALVAFVLIAENSYAESRSLDRYHISLAEKYGYSILEVDVTRVTNSDRLKTLREIGEKTRRQLVDFASGIDADAFTYKTSNDYWRLNKGKRILSYTFSIDIIKNGVKLFDYYCFTILENRENRGFTAGCSAYSYTGK